MKSCPGCNGLPPNEFRFTTFTTDGSARACTRSAAVPVARTGGGAVGADTEVDGVTPADGAGSEGAVGSPDGAGALLEGADVDVAVVGLGVGSGLAWTVGTAAVGDGLGLGSSADAVAEPASSMTNTRTPATP